MMTTVRPLVRRSFRRLAVIATIVLIPAAAHAIWDQVEASRLARRIQHLRDRGEPVNLGAEQRPLATDEERQASRLYYAAGMLAADSFAAWKPDASGAISNPRKALADALVALHDLPSAQATFDPRFARVRAVVQRADPALALLDRATPLRFERFSPERAAYSYQTSDLLNLGAVNGVRTDLFSLQGDARNGAQALLASVRLARTHDRFSQSLSAGTFGSLRLLLERTQPDEDALLALQRAYEELADDDGAATNLVTWRARMLEELWPTTGRPYFAQRLGYRPWYSRQSANRSLTFVILRPWLTHRFVSMLDEFDAAIAIAREGWPEKLRDRQALTPGVPINLETRPPAPRSWIDRMQMLTGVPVAIKPGTALLGAMLLRAGNAVARNRVTVAVLAIERWRRLHAGALPRDLDVLVPRYVQDVPRDPFTGVKLKMVTNADAYVVYSVGVDGKDDHGDIGEWQPDVRWSSPTTPGRDVGMRVPLTPRR
ncbi:MAG: hypothetical protein DMF86_18805 [Acidobacteria bacterium]|nr:MAG: hypothetical protein DMF86_18805 [Acidobacteriota bacterium]